MPLQWGRPRTCRMSKMAKRARSTANTTLVACSRPRQGSRRRRFRGPASRKGGVTACTTTSTGSASCACRNNGTKHWSGHTLQHGLQHRARFHARTLHDWLAVFTHDCDNCTMTGHLPHAKDSRFAVKVWRPTSGTSSIASLLAYMQCSAQPAMIPMRFACSHTIKTLSSDCISDGQPSTAGRHNGAVQASLQAQTADMMDPELVCQARTCARRAVRAMPRPLLASTRNAG